MVLELLEKINPWWSEKSFEKGVLREKYLEKIKSYLKSREIVILTGVRRAGKTTLLLQTIDYLIKNKVNPRQVLFVNFEEPDIANLDNPIKNVLDVFNQEICDADKRAYLFFDEVQSAKDWERWAKSIYDQKKHQLILSGSSSQLVDSKLSTLISGRYLKINVFPLDFKEYLKFNKLKPTEDKLYLAANKNKIIKHMKKYLTEGGFPRAVIEEDEILKAELLDTYYETIVYKDILSAHTVRNTKTMKELVYYLFSNFTRQYSYKKLSESLKIDFTTIKEYLGFIEESKSLFETSIFSYSLKTQSRNNKKIYCIDNGLRNAVSFKFSKDEGKLAENLVFIELKRRNKNAYYWKNKGEVDFVIKNKDQSLTAINVTCTNQVNERETNALLEFKKEFKKTKELLLITKDLEKKEQGIQFMPLWKWLLTP